MKPGDRRVREFLGRHDPAREGEGLSREERARMRQAVLQAVPDRPVRRWPVPLAAGAGLGLAALAFVVSFLVMTRTGPVPVPPSPDAAGNARSAGSPPALMPVRRIQMTTPGGTRIVWILTS